MNNAFFNLALREQLFDEPGGRRYFKCFRPARALQPLHELPLMMVGNLGIARRH
jgi:hypothetical protein